MEKPRFTAEQKVHLILWPTLAFIVGVTIILTCWAYTYRDIRMAEQGYEQQVVRHDVTDRAQTEVLWRKVKPEEKKQ